MSKRTVWVWQNCQGELRRRSSADQKDDNSDMSNTQLGYTDSDRNKQMPIFSYTLSLQKEFPYEDRLGFVWHKSWLIPKLTVSFTPQSWQSLKNGFSESSLWGELLCVVQKDDKCDIIQEVNLIGDTRIDLEGPCFSFSNLKFTKTSFQYQREPFRLLLVVSGTNQLRRREVIISLISPPVYIDSRKQARLTRHYWQQSLLKRPKIQLDQFFDPLHMQKGKRHSKVQNSIVGFLDYYTAQNIRNKIRDPFYIAYHFSGGFRCFFNSSKVRSAFQAMKVLQKSCTDSEILIIEPIEASSTQVKKLTQLFEKSFKLKNVTLGRSQGEGRCWQYITRKQIADAYKEFFEDEQEFQYESDLCKKALYRHYKFTTQIILQTGEQIEGRKMRKLNESAEYKKCENEQINMIKEEDQKPEMHFIEARRKQC